MFFLTCVLCAVLCHALDFAMPREILFIRHYYWYAEKQRH